MVYKCDAAPMSNKEFNEQAAEKFSISWNKIITSRGKTKDYLYVKNWFFGILVTSILVGFLLKYVKPTGPCGSTLFASPGEIGMQFVPLLSYFNIMYIIIVITTYSFLLAEQSENIIPILLSSIPDILVATSSIMMIINGLPKKST